ncbi:hypothetical protein L596_011016 [Steinernema carpocapsae]|uniref:Uncharacterized protein n=1 Tax=Steinernema carpocapsae TaxID=34508 RepID=A0A4U5NTH9_STECR|nr:hypothetical protein L596_011016 [Steinernema carpocapsae]
MTVALNLGLSGNNRMKKRFVWRTTIRPENWPMLIFTPEKNQKRHNLDNKLKVSLTCPVHFRSLIVGNCSKPAINKLKRRYTVRRFSSAVVLFDNLIAAPPEALLMVPQIVMPERFRLCNKRRKRNIAKGRR